VVHQTPALVLVKVVDQAVEDLIKIAAAQELLDKETMAVQDGLVVVRHILEAVEVALAPLVKMLHQNQLVVMVALA
jgi:hypothetical protein